MSEGHSLWLEVIPTSEAESSNGFDRRFDSTGDPPNWEGVAVLCRHLDGGTFHEAVWMAGERLCDLRFSHEDQRLVLLRYVEAPC